MCVAMGLYIDANGSRNRISLDHIRVLNEKYQGFDLECVRVC